jgi:arginyl-tRNA synthetase
LTLLKLEEALAAVQQDYAPNQLVDYLYETAKSYAVFNENCPVIKAETASTKITRLALITLCGRVLKLGLELLGIKVVERM